MRVTIPHISIALLIVLFCSTQLAFSQSRYGELMPLNGYDENTRLDVNIENGLDYRYQARDWSMPRYADSLSFWSRVYVNLGYGYGRDWKGVSKSGVQSLIFGAGYNFSPVHSLEVDGAFGGGENNIMMTYYMNLNNAALRRDAHSRFDVLMGVGGEARLKGSDVAGAFSTSIRGRYNVTRNLGLYVEPRASFGSPLRGSQSTTQVSTSIDVGVSYRFNKPEFYFLDYVLPESLRNPERLDVPYEFDVLPFFAVKSNLLFDAVTAVNVAVEIPIKERWSICGEWLCPWWITDDDTAALQILSANLEGRYWFGDRTDKLQMTGLFAGFYFGGGLYDLRLNSKGYQGEFYIASGISGGYAHAINPSGSLRMEYSLGVGYLNTDYRYYEGRADNRFMVWQYNGRYTWVGPTRASVSLVWMMNINKKRGGKQ